MAWEELRDMTKRQRRDLTRKAAKGDLLAYKQVLNFTNQIKTEVNSRLRKLERSKMDYGAPYNNLMFYLNTQQNSNRLQTPKKLGYDVYEMMLQNEQGLKFLRSSLSTVSGARLSEKMRIQKLQEYEVIPENFSYRQNKEFLRFLGSEEMSATIDQYGRSDVVVKMAWDAFKKNTGTGLAVLKRALTEYLAGQITFDEAMLRSGIKVEDYYSGRPTS